MKAFPVQENVPQDEDFEGMDLRDYFAAKAMQGLLAHGHGIANKWIEDQVINGTVEPLTEWAYGIADAMMEARNDKS